MKIVQIRIRTYPIVPHFLKNFVRIFVRIKFFVRRVVRNPEAYFLLFFYVTTNNKIVILSDDLDAMSELLTLITERPHHLTLENSHDNKPESFNH